MLQKNDWIKTKMVEVTKRFLTSTKQEQMFEMLISYKVELNRVLIKHLKATQMVRIPFA